MNKYGFRLIGKEFDYNNNVRCIISTKVWFFKFLIIFILTNQRNNE
jgi:hypothetical protein